MIISDAPPTDADRRDTAELVDVLREAGLYEDDEQAARRERALCELSDALRRWAPEGAGVQLRTFGSYRLGVQGQGSDLDTLCVGPATLARETFFEGFGAVLREHPKVTRFTAVPAARVPVMKFVFDTVEVDMLYAALAVAAVPDTLDLCDPAVLAGVDQTTVLSLNGCRVTDGIVARVPDADAFRTTLRAVRHWCRAAGLYCNAMGLLAGVQCAVLTARVCQLYPRAAPATLLRKFFALYSQWRWRDRAPVALGDTPRHASLRLPQWGDTRKDRADPVVILTPVYPVQNTMRNAGHYTRRMLAERLREGAARLREGAAWRDLFRPAGRPCKRFLTVSAWAGSAAAQRRWAGFVESRLPALLRCLDRNQRWKTECLEVYPVPGAVRLPEPGRPHQQRFFVGMKTNYDAAEAVLGRRRVDIQDALDHFRAVLEQGRADDAHFEFGLVARKQLPDAVRPPPAANKRKPARTRAGAPPATKKARRVLYDEDDAPPPLPPRAPYASRPAPSAADAAPA